MTDIVTLELTWKDAGRVARLLFSNAHEAAIKSFINSPEAKAAHDEERDFSHRVAKEITRQLEDQS